MKEDLISLLLAVTTQVQQGTDVRGDTSSTINVLNTIPESVSVTDVVTATKHAGSSQWGSFKWGFGAWG